MFKEGDRVICVNNPNAKLGCNGSGWKLNRVFTIQRISGDDIHKILWPSKVGSGIYIEYVNHLSWKKRYGDTR